MKIRQDFVTNSSSSSFIICKKKIDDDQIEAIHEHSTLAKKMGYYNCNSPWSIWEDDEYIYGDTPMDNFNMGSFLDDIDVNPKYIYWNCDVDEVPNVYHNENWRELLNEDKN